MFRVAVERVVPNAEDAELRVDETGAALQVLGDRELHCPEGEISTASGVGLDVHTVRGREHRDRGPGVSLTDL
jgi:hypothetical protein